MGFNVTVDPEIIEEETVKASTNLPFPSKSFMSPEPATTLSLNVNIMFLSSFTLAALSEGTLDIKDGALTSRVTKSSPVLFEIPT